MTKKLSRIVALMLAVIMSFSMLLVPVEAASFKDVSNKAWYKAAVDYVAERGWMSGVSSTTFAPNMKVTRGMAVTVLAKVAEADLSAYEPAFADTEAGKWYTKAAAWANEMGITAGNGNGTFGPNQAVTREQLVTFIYKLQKVQNFDVTVGETNSFADAEAIAGFAQDAVQYCTANNIVSGFEDSSFRPKQTATRAQLATMMMKLDQLRQGYAQPMPAQSFNGTAGEDMLIAVEAPDGALPENSAMTTSRVTDEAKLNSIAAQANGTVLAAADITFKKDDAEIEPQREVVVTISLADLDSEANVSVVHVKDDGTVEPVASELVSITRRGDKAIRFSSRDFSVYAIIGDPEDPDGPYRATYEFYNSDGSPYLFQDITGQLLMNSQILKDGEILEDVGIPTVGASKNAKFVGWYVVPSADSTEYGEKCEVGETKTVTKNETIILKAKMQGIVNVFFFSASLKDDQGNIIERSFITIKQIEFTAGQTDPITVNVSDVTTEAPADMAVVGWNRSEAAANDGTKEDVNGVITLYPNGSGTITDVMLYPAITEAYWLYFDENDGGTGGGASYTPPQYVEVGQKPTEPTAPHRTGYTFGGWYEDPECTTAFNFNSVLTGTKTVYAKWVGAATTYSIVVWVQRTSDSANLTEFANLAEDSRTYDFYKAYTVNANTGDEVYVPTNHASRNLGTTLDADGHIKFNRSDANDANHTKTVAGNGSTVLNVYYDRDVMRIRWYSNSNFTTLTGTWYGLYNATFAEANKTWPTGSWHSRQYPISVMDAFVDFDTRSDTTLDLYPDSASGSYHLYFYKENLNGGFDQVFDRQMTGSTRITLAEKYRPGFDLDKTRTYVRNNSTSYPNNATWTSANAGSQFYNNNSNVHVRYIRNSFDIEYHNGTKNTEGTIVRTDSLKFETSLASHANPTVSYPIAADADHYQFIGWFADSSWTTMVTFTELDETTKQNYTNWYGISTFVVYDKMPAHNFALYAGYALTGWDCALDPNGGDFTSTTQAGVFWLYYGETFSSDIKTNITREGYVFQGWMVANVDGALNITTNSQNNLRYISDDSNWTMTDTPWQFEAGITGPTYLMAKWFLKTVMHVTYDAGEGSDAPTDEGAYSDHANTVAFRSPVAPEGKFFLGWDIQGTATVEKLKPGTVFEVSSDYAVNGTVTLVAVYGSSSSPDDPVPATHIDWYANNGTKAQYPVRDSETFLPVEPAQTVEQPTHSTDFPLQLNKGTDIHSATEFSNYGYKFLGWAKLHKVDGTYYDHNDVAVEAAENENLDYVLGEDNVFLKWDGSKFMVENEGSWVETSQVAADEFTPYDDMFAVWVKDYFYVYHSATGKLEMIDIGECNAEGKFDLTKKVTANHLYGGYYKKSAAVTSENVEAAKLNTLKAADHQTAVTGAETYTGENMKISDGSARFWARADAYGYNETVDPGNAMAPDVGNVYYLKEVPNSYLSTKFAWTYDRENDNKLIDIFELTAVDDSYYAQIGFRDVDGEEPADAYELGADDIVPRDVLAKSFVLRQADKDAVTLDLATLGVDGGYLAIRTIARDGEITAGTKTVLPTWETYDHVVVSKAPRAYNVNDAKDTITASDFEPFDGTTKLYFDFTNVKMNSDDWVYNQNGWTWNIAYFFDGSGNSKEVGITIDSYDGDNKNHAWVTIPAGDWTHVIVIRRAPGSTHNGSDGFSHDVWGKSGDIALKRTQNLLKGFPVIDDYHTEDPAVWGTYSAS